MNKNDASGVKNLLDKLLKSFQSNSQIVDHIYIEQMNSKKYDKN